MNTQPEGFDMATLPNMPLNVAYVTRRIRRCEGDAAAQVVLEHFAMEYARAALAAAPAQSAQPVGKAVPMPGASGFTMAVFEASEIPVGTDLYTAPQPSPTAVVLDERAAFEADYAKVWNAEMKENGWNGDHTADDVKDLREGDTYGEGRDYLNARWEGWQARAASTSANVAQGAELPDENSPQFRAACSMALKASQAGIGPCGAFMAGYRTLRGIAIDVGEPMRFQFTACSQCGKDLGPANSGVSHCEDHS